MFDLFGELLAITKAFDAAGIDYAICGGVALAVHGLPRATKDIDFLVLPDQLDHVRRIAKPLGFTLESGHMKFSSSGVEVVRLVKPAPGDKFIVDLLLVNDVTSPAWSTRRALEFEGGSVWVVSRAGLIELKKKAGRPQDLADIHRLETGE